VPQPQDICLFNEGQISLPPGYQDRSVNIFTAPHLQAPAFNISRDTLQDDETLSAYIDRQLALMKQHLKGWQQTAREHTALGDNLLEGEIVHASYLRDNKRVWQQQAVFTPSDGGVLVFTMTSNTALTPADGTALQTLLRSFHPHA